MRFELLSQPPGISVPASTSFRDNLALLNQTKGRERMCGGGIEGSNLRSPARAFGLSTRTHLQSFEHAKQVAVFFCLSPGESVV